MKLLSFFGRKDKAGSKRAYAGARVNRLTSDWAASCASLDSDLKGSLVTLRNRSRELCQNNDYVRSAQRAVVNNVIGAGVKLQMQIMQKDGITLDEVLNKQIEKAWERWKRAENCDVSGKRGFAQIEQLLMGTTFRDGEYIVRMVGQAMGNTRTPLSLELIETDLLDETYNGTHTNGNQVRMGVEINQWSRPVAYHFRTQHPGDYQHAPNSRPARIRVPVDEIIHEFVFDSIHQSRGVPWLASTMMRLHHMQGYEEAEVISARATASTMGFIESTEGEVPADDVMDGERVTDFEPGVFKYLAPGEKVNVPQLSRPGGQFDPFMRAMLRGVAAGTGVSYESISRDYSQSNYSSSRLALLEDRDNWRKLQAWMISRFHQKVFERWLELAVLAGEVKIKDFFSNSQRYQAARWIARGWSWVDPLREVTAYKDAVRAGFMSLSEVVGYAGGDVDDLLAARAREMKLAEALGLIFDTDPKQVSNAGLTQARPNGTKLPGAGDEPASDKQEGGEGEEGE
jgi:lambda family phage portal protein